MNFIRNSGVARALIAAGALVLSWGCGGANTAPLAVPPVKKTGGLTTYHTTGGTVGSGTIVLRDSAGAPIARGSTVPYSPEKTCGGSCHDVAVITQGYHFQQGRTNADGTIRVSDSFNPKKSWLLSDGMYGKT